MEEKNKSETKEASDEQNFLEEEKESPNQKFKRIATEKCEQISKNITWLLNSPKQPSYEVTKQDAEKILKFFDFYSKLIESRYNPIKDGLKINKIHNIKINNLFDSEEAEP